MAVKDGKKVVLGKVAEEAKKNKPHATIQEATREVFQDMPSVLMETFRRAKEKHKGDFFIEILLKFEKCNLDTFASMHGVPNVAPHPLINVSRACPSPHLKQTVFYHDNAANKTSILWALSDSAHTSFMALAPDDFKHCPDNVRYVRDLNSGKLKQMADVYNRNIKE